MADFINFGEEFETSSFSLIDDGDYEVYIKSVERTVTKNGKNMLSFRFKIRNDVEQNFKNRELFYSIVQKDGDNCYDFNKVNKIILTQSGTSNYKTKFNDFDEVLQYLHGLKLKVTVETTYSDGLGRDVNQVKDWSFASPCAETPVTSDSVTLPGDDLPF